MPTTDPCESFSGLIPGKTDADYRWIFDASNESGMARLASVQMLGPAPHQTDPMVATSEGGFLWAHSPDPLIPILEDAPPSGVNVGGFLSRFDIQGNHSWSRAFARTPDLVAASASGGSFLLFNNFGGSSSVHPCDLDFSKIPELNAGRVVVKINPDGSTVWIKANVLPSEPMSQYGTVLRPTKDDGFLLALPGLIARHDADGIRRWQQSFNITGIHQEEAFVVRNAWDLGDEGFAIVATLSQATVHLDTQDEGPRTFTAETWFGKSILVRFTPNGIPLWARGFNQSGVAWKSILHGSSIVFAGTGILEMDYGNDTTVEFETDDDAWQAPFAASVDLDGSLGWFTDMPGEVFALIPQEEHTFLVHFAGNPYRPDGPTGDLWTPWPSTIGQYSENGELLWAARLEPYPMQLFPSHEDGLWAVGAGTNTTFQESGRNVTLDAYRFPVTWAARYSLSKNQGETAQYRLFADDRTYHMYSIVTPAQIHERNDCLVVELTASQQAVQAGMGVPLGDGVPLEAVIVDASTSQVLDRRQQSDDEFPTLVPIPEGVRALRFGIQPVTVPSDVGHVSVRDAQVYLGYTGSPGVAFHIDVCQRF